MKRLFVPLAVVAAAMFAAAPVAIAKADYESTMLLVQKIFYFHFATWMAMTLAIAVCGVASLVYLFRGSKLADWYAVASAELVVVFGIFGLFSGSLWGRKAWGVWWQWDARVTMATMLVLVFLGYLMVRKYGGPGSEKLAAAMGIFGAATAPFVYKSVDWWRTIHPQTTVMKTLGGNWPGAWYLVWFCTASFLTLTVLMLAARVRLEAMRHRLDEMYLAAEDS
ncbi:MAG TPA: cytochrome c biogenesis protein CcsA [Vicinamibacterales bacterium]|nr:cytochrome c biogenesis protein CcsA [Vicinamibacterales bacterium]